MFKDLKIEDWILFGTGLLLTGASSILSGMITKDVLQNASIFLGIVVGVMGASLTFLFALIKSRLNALQDRVDLQCERSNRDFQIIADSLDAIIKEITTSCATDKVKIVRKRLNGLREILAKKGMRDLRPQIIESIETSKREFNATSSFNIEWWMDPEWFTYLAIQLLLCAQKDSYPSKRYFIYEFENLKDHKDEIRLLHDVHRRAEVEFVMLDRNLIISKFNELISECKDATKDVLKDAKKMEIPDFINPDDTFWYRDVDTGEVKLADDEKTNELKAWLELLKQAEANKEINIQIQEL